MPLEEYRRKRDFGRTPEPAPATSSSAAAASPSSATARPRSTTTSGSRSMACSSAGPSRRARRSTRRRAAWRCAPRTTRSSICDFEGVIPAKEYGGGDVIVWDWGTWEPEPGEPRRAPPAEGEVKFILHGQRLHGRYTIVRTDQDDGRERWLLLKKKDEAAVSGWDAEDHPASIKSRADERRGPRRRSGAVHRRRAAGARRDRPVRGPRGARCPTSSRR